MADTSTNPAPEATNTNAVDPIKKMMEESTALVNAAAEARKAHTRGILTGSAVTVLCLAAGAVGGWFLHQYVK